ncbi:uncharacterized protein EAE97_011853 [Botrytis byssoidea]|uniref:Uncharacterized protein n=1 Tax=Botrytis byssoidea TaxID=139641 RepID=A0A9P5LGB5_9HELO|nr:uncharacterized protein EAE97_011853 [Botrytis byssoidea]KAF7918398.1 hypothetical protein EAE97_011853 [Botrytis byssoidea]
MATNVASTDPPMTFGQRQKLQQLRVVFHVPPHEILYTPILGDIMSRQQLCNFIDGLLKELIHQYPTIISPQPGAWKLIKNDAELDLNAWEPGSIEPDTAIIIASSNAQISFAIIDSSPTTNDESWTWSEKVLSVKFPEQNAFLLQHHDRVLVILRCQTKYRVSNKRKDIRETNHTVFIPMTYTVQHVLGLIQASHVSAVYSDDREDNLRSTGLTARELGWKHGTILRLELW